MFQQDVERVHFVGEYAPVLAGWSIQGKLQLTVTRGKMNAYVLQDLSRPKNEKITKMVESTSQSRWKDYRQMHMNLNTW